MKQLFFFCVALALLNSCNNNKSATADTGSSFSMDSVRAQITASNAIYAETFGKNDSAAFVNCYSSDACINPPGVPKMCGSEKIGGFFNVAVKLGIKKIILTTDELLGGKEGVIETGHYDLQGEGGVSWEKGKYIVTWKEEGGKWKMHRDIWNTDAPRVVPE